MHHALLTVARHADSRMCLVLLGTILENPGLAERLMEVLKAPAAEPAPGGGKREEAFMTWAELYLICFLVGFGLSVLALLAGSVARAPAAPARAPRDPRARTRTPARDGLPWFNFGTIAAFLAWFGGTGYLLQHYYSVWFVVTLGSGDPERDRRGGGRVSVPGQGVDAPRGVARPGGLRHGRGAREVEQLRSAPGGTGELVYSQEGTRRVAGARSEDGAPIPKGSEVIVTRYEKGIAYVRPWEDPMEAEFRKLGS